MQRAWGGAVTDAGDVRVALDAALALRLAAELLLPAEVAADACGKGRAHAALQTRMPIKVIKSYHGCGAGMRRIKPHQATSSHETSSNHAKKPR